MHPTSRFALRLLGGFTLKRNARPCKLAYEKGRALLAYLAVESGREHARTSLAAMFWPDLEREAALVNLRQVLHDLRLALNADSLEAPLLQADREIVRLEQDARLEIDVVEFAAPMPKCPVTPFPSNCVPCLAQMESVAAHYRGEFLAGYALPESPDFEAWLQVQREALHLRALVLLAHLSDCHEQVGDKGKSLTYALRYRRLEPWSEDGLRRTMRLLARSGQRSAALLAYESCCRALKKELGVLPGAEIQALAERIRGGEIPPAADHIAPCPASLALPLPVAERRQVTVLYCELVPVGVDNPDDVLAVLREPQARCAEIIRAFAGYLVQAYGGSFLAYFGYPQGSEHAARLAVQAALVVTHTAFAGVEARVGIHTGVVISGGDPQVPDAIGQTSALAIRLRQLANRGAVAISAATHHLVTGYFDCVSLGFRPLAGIAHAQEVFSIDHDSSARGRLEAATALTPLVGRQEEIATLRALWRDACKGALRIVLLRGDAGIGKSRLVHALDAAIQAKAHAVRVLRCSSEHSKSPFYPLTVFLTSTLAFAPDDGPEARFDKLAACFDNEHAGSDADAVALFANLLGLPLRPPYRAPTSSPEQQREQTLALLLERLYAPAARQPVLLVVEDLQWADPSTLELLTRLITQSRQAPLLAVLTARPEFQSPWLAGAVPMLELHALDDVRTAALVTAVAPALAPVTVRRIVARADGIPLFAEELARDAIDQTLPAIPSSLQDLLAARLDGLGAAKAVAQAAAAIGREFNVGLLRTISPFDPATMSQLLRQFQHARLLQSDGAEVFRFRHALIAEAAYQSQTREQQAAVHRRIAAALQAGAAAVRPEIVARHLAAGGETRAAVACWIEAGKLAHRHSASLEAVAHFESGLALVAALPAGVEQVRLELELQIGLGAAACAAQGYASAAGAAAYARAMALCAEHENSPDMFCSVWGLWASASSRAGYAAALKLARQLDHMARQSGDPVQAQQAHFALADTLYWQGDFTTALTHLERVRTLYRPEHHARHVAAFGEDAGVTSAAYRAWVLWFLGLPEQARHASTQSLVLARQLGHPFSLAYALTFAALLDCRLRESAAALARAQEALALADRHGYTLWRIGATVARGWALAQQGDDAGVDTIRQCVGAMRDAMGGVTLVVLEPLVDACNLRGKFDAALEVIDEAFALGDTLGDRHAGAELYRFKGEALLGLAGTNTAQAEDCFQQALTISRRQQAKTLELRAAMSLARLWKSRRKRAAARGLLDAVYQGFSEGFGIPDLRDARALLDSMATTARR